MNVLFSEQPAWCRAPLPLRDFSIFGNKTVRILSFDPTPVYDRISNLIDPYTRTQAMVQIDDIFPSPIGKVCACGCGHKLTGRQTRYASEACGEWCSDISGIIRGHSGTVNLFFRQYNRIIHGFSDFCIRCESTDQETFVDHIVPVKYGGGGCWLSNYQLLCHRCHRIKTCQDFGLKKKK